MGMKFILIIEYWKDKIDGLSPKKLKLVFGMEVGLICNICCFNIDEIFFCAYIFASRPFPC